MIKKFISIENVGKFRACAPTGDVELRPLTLIYAENGRGKTTLCDILRSLRSGDPGLIQGRATLGPTTIPAVNIRLDDTNATFDGKAWSTTLPALRIFDALFVHQNVYAGELVSHEQKRNLYRVIVGEKGVELACAAPEIGLTAQRFERLPQRLRHELELRSTPGAPRRRARRSFNRQW